MTLVITELSRKLATLQDLADGYATSENSHDRRRFAAISAGIEALRHHSVEVDRERALAPLFVRLLDSALAYRNARSTGEYNRTRSELDEAIDKAMPAAETVR